MLSHTYFELTANEAMMLHFLTNWILTMSQSDFTLR